MSKGFASNYRIVVLALGIFVCFAGVGTRLVFLHVIDRNELVRYIDKARRQIIVQNARRGDILDARGDVLATSRSMLVLGVDPQMLRPEDEAKWPDLARVLGMPYSALQKVFSTKTRAPAPGDLSEDDREIRWAKLKDEISESTYDEVTALGIKGVYGNRIYRRTYPHNQLAAHVIGYINKEETPVTGIERFADFYLRGQNGWRESEKDGRQRELAQFRTREVPATDGFSLVLSIDTVIQHIVERELEHVVRTFSPEKATIIVTDPRTGFVLALANYPTFNLNEFNRADLAAQRNVAITDQLEPGSTFKIISAGAALNEGLVNPLTAFDCTLEKIEYKGRWRNLPKDDHQYDHPLALREIISHSSNRGAAQLGMLLGDERFYSYARSFGFGEETGYPGDGEVKGQLASPDKWDGLTITRLPMGHAVGATPMQIHYGMSVVASGGYLMRPQLIREVRDSSGERVYHFDGVPRRRVIQEKTAQTMAKMLMKVASPDGTAPEAAIPGFEVAGKTGTTQKIINGQYSNKHHIASFVGFFPASRPEVAISVIVDGARPPGGVNAYGRIVAGPSFKRISEQLIQYLDIKPVFDPSRTLLAMEGGKR